MLGGNVVYAASQWGVLVALARLTSAGDVGAYAYALAITAPLFVFANLKLRSAIATDPLQEYTTGQYLGLRLFMVFIASLTAILIGIAGSPEIAALVVVVTVTKAADSVADLYQGLLQRAEAIAPLAINLALNGGATLFLFVAVLFATRSVVLAAGGSLMASLFALMHVIVASAKHARMGNSVRETVKPVLGPKGLRLFIATVPLGVVTTLGSLNANVPRYFVEHYMGKADLGVFAALAYLVIAGNLVINALGQSAVARLARFHAERRCEEFRSLLLRLVLFGLAVGIMGSLIASLFGSKLLSLVYGEAYAKHSGLLVLLMLAAAANYSYIFLGTAITAMRRYSVQLPVAGVAFGVLVLACWRLVPTHGLLGAGWALLGAAIAEAGVGLWVLGKNIRR